MRSSRGFTLIELLLYVGLVSLFTVTSAGLYSMYLSNRVKSQIIADVEQQGLLVMQLLTQSVRNAEGVNTPAIGLSSNSLSVNVDDVTKSPTVFELLDGRIQVKEGQAAPVLLISSKVSLTNLEFSNLSRIGTPGTVRIRFTLSYINVSNRNEYSYSKTFYGTATLR